MELVKVQLIDISCHNCVYFVTLALAHLRSQMLSESQEGNLNKGVKPQLFLKTRKIHDLDVMLLGETLNTACPKLFNSHF